MFCWGCTNGLMLIQTLSCLGRYKLKLHAWCLTFLARATALHLKIPLSSWFATECRSHISGTRHAVQKNFYNRLCIVVAQISSGRISAKLPDARLNIIVPIGGNYQPNRMQDHMGQRSPWNWHMARHFIFVSTWISRLADRTTSDVLTDGFCHTLTARASHPNR